jgi:hypothetical protein
MDYEATDKAALRKALLGLKQCPNCRADLLPVGPALADVFGCKPCKETWYLPQERPA